MLSFFKCRRKPGLSGLAQYLSAYPGACYEHLLLSRPPAVVAIVIADLKRVCIRHLEPPNIRPIDLSFVGVDLPIHNM